MRAEWAPGAELSAVSPAGGPAAPVEYAVAVQRYLEQASLSPGSRRIYGISLASWAWPLVGAPTPLTGARRGARPPAVPLARLDAPDTPARLAAAAARRVREAGPRTLNRELSALRSAVGWWLDRGWISGDPVAGLQRRAHSHAALPPLSGPQVAAVLGLRVSLREQALWQLLYDSGWPAGQALALDAGAVDLAARRARGGAGPPRPWCAETADLLSWLLVGRRSGPLFLTDRRAPSRAPAADVCPMTGRARMSYRRAAEIFTTATRPLDPSGRGWTLHQLSAAAVRGATS
jgi:integrase